MNRLAAVVLLAACAPAAPTVAPPAPEPGRVGLLVMAHGGAPEWNESVSAAVAPVALDLPAVIAFGMADPSTLAAGLDSLKSLGVGRVAVVRLFVSGESFLEQTEYLLGLRSEPPSTLLLMGRDPHSVGPIGHDLELATHRDGLMDSKQAARILVDRALEVSTHRTGESVLLLAHGMGAEERNDRVLHALGVVAERLEELGFARAAAGTLREDWAEARADAEASIRRFVESESAAGRRVIVVPMRLSGFGPYAEVLEGLEYVAGRGLVPHDEVTDWIRSRATSVICARGWTEGSIRCGPVVVRPASPSR